MEEKLQKDMKVCWACSNFVYLLSSILCIALVYGWLFCLIKYAAHDHVPYSYVPWTTLFA